MKGRFPRVLGGMLALLGACSGEADESPEPCSEAEICDGIDQDCDGTADEGVQTVYHPDNDGDGFGAYLGAPQCSAPVGYVTDGTDCNDTLSDVYPGAPERCDGLDQDCDAASDEGAYTTYFADQDDDGFGATLNATNACQRPPDYVDVPGDCDDTDDETYPGASEACDGVDNDCDGAKDEGALLGSGIRLSACNPTGSGSALSPGGFTPGVSGHGWGVSGPILYEDGSDNDSLDSAQALPLWGLPFALQGRIDSASFDGINYTGDVDAFTFQSSTGGTLKVRLVVPEVEGASAAALEGLDLLAYDERAEGFIGPVSGVGDPDNPEDTKALTLTVAGRSEFTVMVAGRRGEGGPYGVQITYEGSATPHQPFYQVWYGGDAEMPFIGTATSPDGIEWANFGTSILMGEDCEEPIEGDVLSPSVSPGPEGYEMAFLGLPLASEAPRLFLGRSANGMDWSCEGPLIIEDLPDGIPGPFAPALVIHPDGGRSLFFLEGGACGPALNCTSSTLAWAYAAPRGPLRYEGPILSGGAIAFKAIHTQEGAHFALVSESDEIYLGSLDMGRLTLGDDPAITPAALLPWEGTPIMGAQWLPGPLGERVLIFSDGEQGVGWIESLE